MFNIVFMNGFTTHSVVIQPVTTDTMSNKNGLKNVKCEQTLTNPSIYPNYKCPLQGTVDEIDDRDVIMVSFPLRENGIAIFRTA